MTENRGPERDPLLQESEERYRTVIENASDMIQSVRPDGSFEFVNAAWHKTLGYTPEDLPNLSIWDIIHPDSVEECQVHFGLAIQGIPVDNIRAIFRSKDGRAIPSEGNAHSRIVDGKVVATHSFFRDITERLRSQELEVRNAQLEREQQARYLEKMAALGKLSAGLSHELNNPAAAAQRSARQIGETLAKRDAAARELMRLRLSDEHWNLLESLVDQCMGRRPEPGEFSLLETSFREDAVQDWLQDRGIAEPWNYAATFVQGGIAEDELEDLAQQLPEGAIAPAVRWMGESLAVQDHSNVITRSSNRISELVGAVKAYSFRDQAIEQEVDIHDGLENTLVILAYRLRGVTVDRYYDRTLPKIRTQGSGLNQVWTNILDNAVDAIDGSGNITIRTSRSDNWAVVEISDDGQGIDPDVLSRIFEPFFTTKTQGQGTGLGLDIVWRIVTEDHNGRIETESEPGCTTFRIMLPLSPDS